MKTRQNIRVSAAPSVAVARDRFNFGLTTWKCESGAYERIQVSERQFLGTSDTDPILLRKCCDDRGSAVVSRAGPAVHLLSLQGVVSESTKGAKDVRTRGTGRSASITDSRVCT